MSLAFSPGNTSLEGLLRVNVSASDRNTPPHPVGGGVILFCRKNSVMGDAALSVDWSGGRFQTVSSVFRNE